MLSANQFFFPKETKLRKTKLRPLIAEFLRILPQIRVVARNDFAEEKRRALYPFLEKQKPPDIADLLTHDRVFSREMLNVKKKNSILCRYPNILDTINPEAILQTRLLQNK